MSIEENIKNEADYVINHIRERMNSVGNELSDEAELYLRIGISFGMSICDKGAKAAWDTPMDITLGDKYE